MFIATFSDKKCVDEIRYPTGEEAKGLRMLSCSIPGFS